MVVVVAPLSYTYSPPPLLAQNTVHLNVTHPPPPPASAAHSEPYAACLCLPSYPAAFAPHFQPHPAPRSLSAPGFLLAESPFAPLYTTSLPMWCSASRNLLDLVPLGIYFEQVRGGRAHTLPVSCSSQLPSPRYMATSAPSGYPPPSYPLSLPLGCLDPIPVSKVGGA